jgi:hypothetical protein
MGRGDAHRRDDHDLELGGNRGYRRTGRRCGRLDRRSSNDLLVDRVVRAAPGAEPTDDATRQQVGRILVSAVTSPEGITQADREYIVALTAERAGIPPEEADQRIEETLAAAQQLENEARALAEQARRTAMISAFLLAVSLALGAAVAYYAATLGGNHRDRQIVVPGWYKPW